MGGARAWSVVRAELLVPVPAPTRTDGRRGIRGAFLSSEGQSWIFSISGSSTGVDAKGWYVFVSSTCPFSWTVLGTAVLAGWHHPSASTVVFFFLLPRLLRDLFGRESPSAGGSATEGWIRFPTGQRWTVWARGESGSLFWYAPPCCTPSTSLSSPFW